MIKKAYTKTRRSCRVTFNLPPEVNVGTVSLCGDFNAWSPADHYMKRRKDGRLSTTISLQAGRAYQFKYLLDGQRWENDPAADGYVPNDYGSEDSLVKV